MSFEIESDPVFPEVLLVRPARYADARGWFRETYNDATFRTMGITPTFVQDNQSYSSKVGTVRGLHFQRPPNSQAKLVRCIRGRILDVAVDLRLGSPTFGRYSVCELTSENGMQVFIPEGFAHGFCTLEPDCEIAYKVSGYHAPASEAGVAFNDPDIGIRWPFPENAMTLSDKDRNLPRLATLGPVFGSDFIGRRG
jgi:dTDP-4-dehydrorhamnose 3,5-epimerase